MTSRQTPLMFSAALLEFPTSGTTYRPAGSTQYAVKANRTNSVYYRRRNFSAPGSAAIPPRTCR
eukprot:243110-Chlamydomonas_euryale.AAC.1